MFSPRTPIWDHCAIFGQCKYQNNPLLCSSLSIYKRFPIDKIYEFGTISKSTSSGPVCARHRVPARHFQAGPQHGRWYRPCLLECPNLRTPKHCQIIVSDRRKSYAKKLREKGHRQKGAGRTIGSQITSWGPRTGPQVGILLSLGFSWAGSLLAVAFSDRFFDICFAMIPNHYSTSLGFFGIWAF